MDPRLATRFESLTTDVLGGPSPQRFPVRGPTLFGALTFLAQHDSSHVEQLALLRKHAGLPAMRFAEPPFAPPSDTDSPT